ncbi:unnamed protein product [Clonostachys rosea]|uniref:Thioredoxin-like fold domain-containing protein n=1 Tax=Bionectria ochroleuca TaxID=29856 RepID=A0ABY6USR8_BIOOC|nr:unnamed protein product [Clonostachys rosea]
MCREHRLNEPFIDRDGKECFNGGPFFDESGQMICHGLIREDKTLADTITEISGQDKKQFPDLASHMLH